MTTTLRRCKACGEEKPIGLFPLSRGRHIWKCRPCETERIRKWQQDRTAQLRLTEKFESITEKKCVRCEMVKSATEFPRRLNRGVGIDPYCRDCRTILSRERRENFPAQVKAYDRKRSCKKRGVSVAEFNAKMTEQKGCCAICKDHVGDGIHIDHCHTTGQFRGLLCSRCNTGIGMFKDDPERLLAAANYLKASD